MDYKNKFSEFEDKKLIDIVKNYKQYGYSEELRNAAIELLAERGTTVDDLKLGGNFSNHTFDRVEEIFDDYNRYSKAAFVLYFIILAHFVLVPLSGYNGLLGISNILVMIAYIFCIAKSLKRYSEFYESIGKKQQGRDAPTAYFVLGIPFYLFMYFFYRGQIREEMRMVK